MIAMPNSQLALHKETLKNKISIKQIIKIINLGAINCPVGRNGLNTAGTHLPCRFLMGKIVGQKHP